MNQTVRNIRWLSSESPGLDWQSTVPNLILKFNIFLLPVLFLLSLLHFKILMNKEIRSQVIYIFHLSLSFTNLIYTLTSWFPAFLHFLRPVEKYCYRSYTYFEITVQLVFGTIRDSTIIYSNWIICYMAVYSGLGVFLETFQSSKVAFWNCVVVMVLSVFGAINLWTKHKIREVTLDFGCEISFIALPEIRYAVVTPADYDRMYLMVLNLIRGVIRGPCYSYPAVLGLLLIMLIVVMLKPGERSQKTTSIVLSLCQTFTMLACKLPDILIPFLQNFVYEKSLREATAQIAAWSTVAMIINQFLQVIICIVVSAKYRESGKMVFRRSERVVGVGGLQ